MTQQRKIPAHGALVDLYIATDGCSLADVPLIRIGGSNWHESKQSSLYESANGQFQVQKVSGKWSVTDLASQEVTPVESWEAARLFVNRASARVPANA